MNTLLRLLVDALVRTAMLVAVIAMTYLGNVRRRPR